MVNFLPWWEQYPGRLEHERSALQSLGIAVHEDPDSRAEGVIRWRFDAPDAFTGQGTVRLSVTFPEFYPFLRPDVSAPDLDMAHHQHPFGKNLCLIGRASAAWDTENDLAWLIREQLRKALTLGRSEDRGGDEEDQGEPFSDYYSYEPNAMVLVDSAWSPPAGVACGVVSVRVASHMPIRPETQSLFMIECVTDSTGVQVFKMPDAVSDQYKEHQIWTARWTHIPEPIKTADAAVVWDAVEAIDGPCQGQTFRDADFMLRLVSFPEEHSQNGSGTGWIFLIQQLGRVVKDRKANRSGDPSRRVPRRARSTFHVVRSGRIGPADMRARLASESPLISKKVLLIGAGAIGSVIADQLARSGIEALTVIDHDVLEPGNLVRHANNLMLVGTSKSGATAALALQVNPYLKVQAHAFPVGSGALGPGQRALLDQEYERADLVIDATAEVGVQRLSASLARQAVKPWIGAWATNGAIGGAVLHIPAGAEWCFSCFEWARSEDVRLRPPASPAPLTQPVGCAEPTFLGAGYNLNEVSVHAARTAMAAISGKYTHDAAFLSMEHPSGAELPQWSAVSLIRHHKCLHR